jgi:hypothetical protein
MKPEDALAVAGRILDEAGKAAERGRQERMPHMPFGGTPSGYLLPDRFAAEAALLRRLPPGDAAPVAREATEQALADPAVGEALRDRFMAPGSEKVLQPLIATVAGMAERMTAEDAAATLQKVVEAIGGPEERASKPALAAVPRVIEALAGRMTAAGAREQLRRALQALARPSPREDRKGQENAALVLAGRLQPEAAAALQDTIDILAGARNPSAPEPLIRVAAALAAQCPTPALVQALKQPATVGEARQAVLRELGKRENHSFGDLWEAVGWLRENEPALDLAPPARRIQP